MIRIKHPNGLRTKLVSEAKADFWLSEGWTEVASDETQADDAKPAAKPATKRAAKKTARPKG